ncbi:hypothetical protein N1F78_01100 [Seonamhaeicola sp. MEBiC1930]|uniref:hypothetical protein n=1 Tax=Seonamhaeicola sp. MEBiC01930 TaxID=2976768 RepID=UPI00324AD9A9
MRNFKKVFQNERVFNYENLNLNYVLELEKKLKSEDISPSYRIGLGEGIYPNKNNHKLEISRNFKRIIKPNFSLEVDYHFTKDSTIRVIMYEWNDLKRKSFKSENENLKTKKAFEKKFTELTEMLTEKYGEPTISEIESENPKDGGTYRDGIKWLNKNGMNAYLFAFGNTKGSYNQIRLSIYPN